jgi:hypothetical protein
MKPELMRGTPPEYIYACNPSGWIRHFISSVKPTAEEPVILVSDGHYSHVRNIDVINNGRQNHVAIVYLLSHSSQKM